MNSIKKIFSETTSLLPSLLTATLLSLTISAVYAWSGPTASPPNNNTPSPVNIGAANQSKLGGLFVASLSVDGGISTRGAGTVTWGDINTGVLAAVTSIYSYGSICTGNSGGACDGTGGTVIGAANAGASNNIPNTGPIFFKGGSVSVSNNLSVAGALTAGSLVNNGNLTVNGSESVSGTLGVTGAATLNSTMHVVGNSTLDGSATIGGTLGVTGTTTLSGATVAGAVTANKLCFGASCLDHWPTLQTFSVPITSGSSWSKPANVTLVYVECVGAGGTGANGAGGGGEPGRVAQASFLVPAAAESIPISLGQPVAAVDPGCGWDYGASGDPTTFGPTSLGSSLTAWGGANIGCTIDPNTSACSGGKEYPYAVTLSGFSGGGQYGQGGSGYPYANACPSTWSAGAGACKIIYQILQ